MTLICKKSDPIPEASLSAEKGHFTRAPESVGQALKLITILLTIVAWAPQPQY